jgi:hypothetical protein
MYFNYYNLAIVFFDPSIFSLSSLAAYAASDLYLCEFLDISAAAEKKNLEFYTLFLKDESTHTES